MADVQYYGTYPVWVVPVSPAQMTDIQERQRTGIPVPEFDVWFQEAEAQGFWEVLIMVTAAPGAVPGPGWQLRRKWSIF